MDERKRAERDAALWQERFERALGRIPLTPHDLIEMEQSRNKDFYCIPCDSAHCTCIKEKT